MTPETSMADADKTPTEQPPPEDRRDRRREGHAELAFAITALCDAFRLSNNTRHRSAALSLADLLADEVLGPDGPSQRDS
jgi:hypothetical protein